MIFKNKTFWIWSEMKFQTVIGTYVVCRYMLAENALELQSFKWSSKIVLQLANVFVDGLEPQNFKCLNKIELSVVDVENFI